MVQVVNLLRVLTCFALLSIAAPTHAQGTRLAFGSVQQDSSEPIEVSADQLEVDQNTRVATFTGDVIIVQGEMRLSAPKVVVVYREDKTGIESLEATGGAMLVSAEDAAEADRADYDVDAGQIVMIGNVLLTQEANALAADRMTVRLDDGTAVMQGRVKTILNSGEN